MISFDPTKMKIARRITGACINGYGGYFGCVTNDGDVFFIIAIPQDQASVADLMREIESKE